MTLDEFKTELRLRRGKLTKFDEDIETIYTEGTAELAYFALNKKLMGIHNIAWVAVQSKAYQKRFTDWMADKHWKAEKNELDLWFTDNPGDNYAVCGF